MTFRTACASLFLGFLLAGCGGGMSLWPFGSSGTELSRRPSDSTEYQCTGGKAFYVRNLDAGAVWLIAPDRQIRLEKPAAEKEAVYTAGKIRLELTAEGATLLDPPAQFLGCKRAEAK